MPLPLRERTPPQAGPPTTGELPSLRTWLQQPGQAEVQAPAGPSAPPRPRPEVNALLPASGPGFYSYAAAARRFGRPETVQALLAIAAAWQRLYPSGPRIGIGSISLDGGGPMPPHRTHRDGLDVDFRPVRSDGREAPVTWRDPAYSRAHTQRLVDLLLGNRVLGVQRILFNDPAVTGVRAFLGHDNHLHVRFLAPAAAQPPAGPAQPPAGAARPPAAAQPPPAGVARPRAGVTPPAATTPPRPGTTPAPARPPAGAGLPAGAGAPAGGGPPAGGTARGLGGGGAGPAPRPAAAPERARLRLGLLVARLPDGRRFRYRLTEADLLCTARLLARAGGEVDGPRLARAMLRRFARAGRRHRSFARFVQAAVRPEMLAAPPWGQLPRGARRAALHLLLGRDPRLARGAVRVRPPSPPAG